MTILRARPARRIAARESPAPTPAAAPPAATRRFELVAYTGGPMSVGGFRQPLVVDLATLRTAQRIPLLLDHITDLEYVVGQSERVRVESGRVLVTGVVMGVGERAVQVLRLAETGYVWQASVGGDPAYYDEVREGESVTVNGRVVAGPCLVAREMKLHEVSFVSLGADPNTTAVLAAAPVRRATDRPRPRRPSARRLVVARYAEAVRQRQPASVLTALRNQLAGLPR